MSRDSSSGSIESEKGSAEKYQHTAQGVG
jgi:hypothetical protein